MAKLIYASDGTNLMNGTDVASLAAGTYITEISSEITNASRIAIFANRDSTAGNFDVGLVYSYAGDTPDWFFVPKLGTTVDIQANNNWMAVRILATVSTGIAGNFECPFLGCPAFDANTHTILDQGLRIGIQVTNASTVTTPTAAVSII